MRDITILIDIATAKANFEGRIKLIVSDRFLYYSNIKEFNMNSDKLKNKKDYL
jgi:hypothetical protein